MVMLRAIVQPDAAAKCHHARCKSEEVRAIEALPVVRTLAQLPGTGTTRAGFQATLWWYAGREHGGCGKKRSSWVRGRRALTLGTYQNAPASRTGKVVRLEHDNKLRACCE